MEQPQPGFIVHWSEDDPKIPESIFRVTWKPADQSEPEYCGLMEVCNGFPETISVWVAEVHWATGEEGDIVLGCTNCAFAETETARYVRQDEAPFWMLGLLGTNNGH